MVAAFSTKGMPRKRQTNTEKSTRRKDEDRHVHGNLPQYSGLTREQKKAAFENTFKTMQREHGDHKQVGSTATAVTVTGNSISVANVGDSPAFVVIRNKNTGKVETCVRLNALHDETNKNERDRVLKEKGAKFTGGYLFGVAVSRAIGDRRAEQAGLSHDPEFIQQAIAIPEDCEAFVIVASDGLTDVLKQKDKNGNLIPEWKNISDEKYLKQKIEALPKNITADEMPKALVNAAIKDGSTDDITVLCEKIDPKSQETKLLAVFDGHGGGGGGHLVSNALSKNFMPELEKNVKIEAQKNQTVNAKPATKTETKAETKANTIEAEKKTTQEATKKQQGEKEPIGKDVVKLSKESEEEYLKELNVLIKHLRKCEKNMDAILQLIVHLKELYAILITERKKEAQASGKNPTAIGEEERAGTLGHYLDKEKDSLNLNVTDRNKLNELIEIAYYLDERRISFSGKSINMKAEEGSELAPLWTYFYNSFESIDKPKITSPSLETFVSFLGVTKNSPPELILNALFTASSNPFVEFDEKAHDLIGNLPLDEMTAFIKKNPNTVRAFPLVWLKGILSSEKQLASFGVTKDSPLEKALDLLFSLSDNPFVEFEEKAHDLIGNLPLNEMTAFIKKNPNTARAFPRVWLAGILLNEEHLASLGVTKNSPPEKVLDLLFRFSDNPFVDFGKKALKLTENISIKDMQVYADKNPNTKAAFPLLRLANIFSKHVDSFDTTAFIGREVAKKTHAQIKDISIDAIVAYVERDPEAFSIFFKKREFGHAFSMGRNFRKEVAERPDLVEKLFLIRNDLFLSAEQKQKARDDFSNLAKSSHFDWETFESGKVYETAKNTYIQTYKDEAKKEIGKIKNENIRDKIENRLMAKLESFKRKDWPTQEEIQNFVKNINNALTSDKGLTKGGYIKICTSQGSVFFDTMMDAGIDFKSKKLYKVAVPNKATAENEKPTSASTPTPAPGNSNH